MEHKFTKSKHLLNTTRLRFAADIIRIISRFVKCFIILLQLSSLFSSTYIWWTRGENGVKQCGCCESLPRDLPTNPKLVKLSPFRVEIDFSLFIVCCCTAPNQRHCYSEAGNRESRKQKKNQSTWESEALNHKHIFITVYSKYRKIKVWWEKWS